ncbi:MAG: O-antigen ligase family protein [Acetobacteraceae bacterium]
MPDRATLRPPALALAGFLLLGGACAALAPAMYWILLEAAGGLGAAALIWRHTAAASAVWLIVTACTLEMTLQDLIGPAAFAATIALVKAGGVALAIVCMLRYGPRLDVFNPAWAFVAMFIAGLAHGLHPGLSTSDSLRSLIGSAAPYAFGFSRLSRGWARAVIRAAQWAPMVSVAGGAVLAMTGLRALFVDSGGLRLEALGHPAFLAGAALAAVYASLIELYRDGRRRDLALLGVNLLILLLTGARAPLMYGAAVVLLTLAFVPAPAMPGRRRGLLLLLVALALPVLFLAAESLSGLRVFSLLLSDASDLSGREELWPYFEQAAARSPWFGWGVGAGNTVVPQTSDVVLQMHTWAAHNEWLRMLVEGGQIGRAALVGMFVLWCLDHTRRLIRAERAIMRLVFIAFACHAFTDNVLISTSACVLFAFCAAVFARGALEAAG